MQTDSRDGILNRIDAIVGKILDIPDLHLSETSTARDVPGWDSLTHVQIIIGVEREFGIRMSASEVAQLDNAGSLIDVVQYHQSNASGA